MNDKLRALKKLFNWSDDKIRYNRKLVSTLISGSGPTPPGPTPTVNIVFKVHTAGSDQQTAPFTAGNIDIVVDSFIEGVFVPFTAALKTTASWCTPTVNGDRLNIAYERNPDDSERVATIVCTQQELCGEEKTFEVVLTQEENTVAFDFISNDIILSESSIADHTILTWLLSDCQDAQMKPISNDATPVTVLDPKTTKNYDLFETSPIVFQNSGSLESAEILAYLNITSIPDSAFSGSSKLAKVVIPESVQSIGVTAFRYCGSYEPSYHEYVLTKFYFLSSTPPTMDASAFTDCMIDKIYVPVGAGNAYKAVLVGLEQYVEEINVAAAGDWGDNTGYKFDSTDQYYKAEQEHMTYAEAINYINS